MFKLLKYLKRQEVVLAIVAVAFVAVGVWLDMTMPEYMAKITMLVQTEGSAMSEILENGALMLLCAFGSLTAAVISAICSSKIAAGFSATLRDHLFSRVSSFSMEEIGKFSTASLITRSTNDVTQVQLLIVMGLSMLVRAPIMAVWAISKISTEHWEWTAATGVAVAVLLVVIGICLIIAIPRFKKMQRLTDDLNRVTRENLTGLKVVRAYNAEDYQEKKFAVANTNLTSNALAASRTMAFMSPSIQAIMSGLTLAIYWIGAILINRVNILDPSSPMGINIEKITERGQLFADMMVFSQYAIMVVMSFMMLVVIFVIMPRSLVAAGRIREVLDVEPSIVDGRGEKGEGRGRVEFRDVSFAYPDAENPVISNISFSAESGETVALIGATGCGKSTVINLIPRFYDATEGEVLVDGVNVRDYRLSELREKLGYISQKATLFGGSIESNIAFGKTPADIDVEKAVEIAQSKDFVESMEGGYSAHVAQGGSNLSGGQKQRISIARAIARHPEILIFDDSFSALDYKTDRALREALDKETHDTTRIIVAQRIGTIRDADKIIVLEDGKIVGMGKHDELMKTSEVYREIALSQLSEDEL